MAAEIVVASSSTAFIADAAPVRRLPLRPTLTRPAPFMAAFEDRALAYDCFRHHDGSRVLIVGPPPCNLRPLYRAARYEAEGRPLRARHFRSLSVTLTELSDVPPGGGAIDMMLGAAGEHRLPIQPSGVPDFAGSRMLVSMNKDNDLAWIAEWARYHAVAHGTDAVLLFDNGSSRYSADDVAQALAAVPGIARVCVPSWPHKFGPIDQALNGSQYWARFLQIGSLGVALRRFGRRARGMLNCDVDELVHCEPGSIYAAAEAWPGNFTFKGQWVEALAAPGAATPITHRAFWRRLKAPAARSCRQSKWVIDPRRRWLDRLSVHPYWHWIANRPLLAKRRLTGAFYWHFKGINTNWKTARTAAVAPDLTEPDLALAAAFAGITAP